MRKLSKNNLKKYRSKSKKYRSKKYKFRAKNDGMEKSDEKKDELNSKKGDDELSLSGKGDDELSPSGKGEHDCKDIENKFNYVLTNSSIKHLYLGDSFIKIFSGCTNNKTMLILSFPGKTASGLSKEKSEIRTNLLKNEILENLECLILHFGSVDIHFSYFHKLSNLDDTTAEEEIIKSNDDFVKYNDNYISGIVENYVSFINEIKKKKSELKIFVLIPYYSPVEDENMLDNLQRYIREKGRKPLSAYSNKIQQKLLSFNNRKSLVDLFDKKMKNKFTDDDSVNIISINDQIIGISRQYLLDDKTDIHLNNKVSNIYKEMLEKCGL